MIKAIIFDFDGVLADSKEVHRLSYNKALGGLKIKISQREFSKYFGKPSDLIIKDLLKKHRIKGDVNKIYDLKNEIYLENINRVRLNKNGVRLIKILSKNYKIAIASNTKIREIELLLKRYKIKKYIKLILGWDNVKKHKPHPEIYLKVAKGLHVKPKECIVIEDSPYGVEAAKRAGMKSIAVLTTYKKHELKKADLVLRGIKGLDKYLNKKFINKY